MTDVRMDARQIADFLNSRGGWKKATPRKSSGYMALCPNHRDRNPSLSVRETENGRVILHCFATTCTDTRAVYASVESALSMTPGELGGPGSGYEPPVRTDNIKNVRASFDPIVPVPPDAPAFSASSRRFRSKSHGLPVKTWTYRNEAGEVMGHIARYEKRNEDGAVDKMIWPWVFATRRGKREWVVGAMPEPRPAYNVDRVAAAPLDAVIQWHEGEKAADAGELMFPDWIATTTPGGGSAPHLTDLSPFAGRRIVMCPDADAAGIEYAQLVGARLLEIGASVRILRFPTGFVVEDGALVERLYVMKDGDDMADHVARGWSTDLLREAVSRSGLPLTWSLDGWEG